MASGMVKFSSLVCRSLWRGSRHWLSADVSNVVPARTMAHKPVSRFEEAESRKRELFEEDEEDDTEEGQLHRLISQDADTVDKERQDEVERNLRTIKPTKFVQTTAADSHVTTSVFHDEVCNKFVNMMMKDGKKVISQRILLKAFEVIKGIQLEEQRKSAEPESFETDPLVIFKTAVENAKPVIGVQAMKKAGHVYQVPCPLTPSRRRFYAMKWLIKDAREQHGPKTQRMHIKLAHQILKAYNNEGSVIQKKYELHKAAESNRAFAHFRWW